VSNIVQDELLQQLTSNILQNEESEIKLHIYLLIHNGCKYCTHWNHVGRL